MINNFSGILPPTILYPFRKFNAKRYLHHMSKDNNFKC